MFLVQMLEQIEHSFQMPFTWYNQKQSKIGYFIDYVHAP